MRYLVAAVLSALLLGWANTDTPVKNLASKAVVADTTGQTPRKSEQPEPTAKQVETPAPTPPEETPATQPEPAPVVTPEPVQQTPVTGSKEDMMSAAGIPTSDWAAVDFIVSKESTWNATAVNPSSGSCGLVQELPCGKSGCNFGDGVCQLRWATQYAVGRYGSWWSAQGFWASNRWW